MRLYLDTAYIAKCYLNDPDSPRVLRLIQAAESLSSSAWALPEMACAFHRRVREGALNPIQARQLRGVFHDHVANGVWRLLPLTETILSAVDAALENFPTTAVLRAGDAVHLVSARDHDFAEIWSNDRHLLRAAAYFDLTGRSV